MKIVALERKSSNARTPEGDEKRAKRTKRAEPSSEPAAHVEPVTETAAVPTQTAESDAIDGELDSIIARQTNGTLQAHLLKVGREYAKKKIAEEEDQRWQVVLTMSNADIWSIIEWCEYERGACTMLARRVNAWAKTGGVQ